METVIERPKSSRNPSLLQRPINNAAPTGPVSVFWDDDVGALPSMFQRPRAAKVVSARCATRRRGGFPAYIVIAVLSAVAPLQVTLLMSKEGAIEQVVAVAKRSAAALGTLLSVPSAEAAISSQSKSLPSELSLSFEDSKWFEAVDTFKQLLAERDASAMKQAENDRLLSRLAAWVNGRTHNSANTCPSPSLDCQEKPASLP